MERVGCRESHTDILMVVNLGARSFEKMCQGGEGSEKAVCGACRLQVEAGRTESSLCIGWSFSPCTAMWVSPLFGADKGMMEPIPVCVSTKS